MIPIEIESVRDASLVPVQVKAPSLLRINPGFREDI